MNVLVAVFSPSSAWTLPARFIEHLRQEFPEHTILDAWDRDTLVRLLPDADVAFTAAIEPDMSDRLSRLRWIQSPAAGVGGLLTSPALVDGPVVMTSARGVRARSIAEHVLGVTLALARQLPLVLRRQADHQWALEEIEHARVIRTLKGQRLTIVGLGSIGVEVARVAAPFGFRVTAIRKRVSESSPAEVEATFPSDRLLDVLETSDVIVLSTALTRETRHLIDANALARVKRGALLINVGRGKLIDDDAVIEALRDGRLGGAALDVFTKEPLNPDSPYWDLPNVIVTPHISGAMEDYWTPLVALFSENLRRFEAGEPLLNVVDKHAGY